MTSPLANHISCLLLSALYIGKLPFLSTIQKIQKCLKVTPVALTKHIAQSCQSMTELTWSIYWAYVILLN